MNNNEMISAIRKGANATDLIDQESEQLRKDGRSETNLAFEYAFALGTFKAKLESAFDRIIYLEDELNIKLNRKRK
jgi:hypothetical protein